jgi:hypothetical protein
MGVQISKVGKSSNRERLITHEGTALAQTHIRARGLTQPLVVVEWTLGPAVTHMVDMHTHAGRPTSVETRAGELLTASFVLAIQTV